tara:strand:- start:136 stop:387 length:252 start_codon:yes stop_codon:yes gene_type:complete
MKVNLKDFCKEKEILKHVQKLLNNEQLDKSIARKLEKVIRFYEEIEQDLEMCGESITELDKPRLEAIEERNKMLSFIHNSDDV